MTIRKPLQDLLDAFALRLAATAEIHQRKRSVMDYLLSPVMRASSEAARER